MEELEYNVCRPSGYVLEGRMVQPRSSTGTSACAAPRLTIVMCHGVLSNRDHNFAQAMSHSLARATGSYVLRFDFRFVPSECEPAFRYRFSGFEDDLDDMRCVIARLKADGYMPWLLLGHSRGANDVLMFAARHAALCGAAEDAAAEAAQAGPRFAVVAISSRLHMPAMFSRLFPADTVERVRGGATCDWETKRGVLQVTPDDAEVVLSRMDMSAEVRRIPAEIPVLLVHGREDDVIPVADAEACNALRDSADLIIIEGAKHAYSGKKQQRELLDRVTAWCVAQLRRVTARL